MPLAALQERLAGIAAAAGAHPPQDELLRFLPADYFRDGLPDLASQQGRDLLQRLANGVSLVVLDNLSSLARGRENEADDWQPMQDLVLNLRRSGHYDTDRAPLWQGRPAARHKPPRGCA